MVYELLLLSTTFDSNTWIQFLKGLEARDKETC